MCGLAAAAHSAIMNIPLHAQVIDIFLYLRFCAEVKFCQETVEHSPPLIPGAGSVGPGKLI